MLAAEKKEKAKTAAKPKVADYAAFVNAENHAYNQLRKRTIALLKLDKELIKKATKSLLKFNLGAKKPNDLLEGDDDFIYLEIILSKVPEEISIRPLQMYAICLWQTHSFRLLIILFWKTKRSSNSNLRRRTRKQILHLYQRPIARIQGQDKEPPNSDYRSSPGLLQSRKEVPYLQGQAQAILFLRPLLCRSLYL